MKQQVGKALAANSDRQFVHVREIRLTQPAWHMLLREEHLAPRPFGRPPPLEVPLQGAQLSVGKLARVLALQCLENRLGFQSRLDIDLLLDLLPDAFERVGACTPGPLRVLLARQFAAGEVLPRCLGVDTGLGGRYLLSSRFSTNLFNLLTCASLTISTAPVGAIFDGR